GDLRRLPAARRARGRTERPGLAALLRLPVRERLLGDRAALVELPVRRAGAERLAPREPVASPPADLGADRLDGRARDDGPLLPDRGLDAPHHGDAGGYPRHGRAGGGEPGRLRLAGRAPRRGTARRGRDRALRDRARPDRALATPRRAATAARRASRGAAPRAPRPRPGRSRSGSAGRARRG